MSLLSRLDFPLILDYHPSISLRPIFVRFIHVFIYLWVSKTAWWLVQLVWNPECNFNSKCPLIVCTFYIITFSLFQSLQTHTHSDQALWKDFISRLLPFCCQIQNRYWPVYFKNGLCADLPEQHDWIRNIYPRWNGKLRTRLLRHTYLFSIEKWCWFRGFF